MVKPTCPVKMGGQFNEIVASSGVQRVQVVEYDGNKDQEGQQVFWNKNLKTEVALVRLDNILSFTDS
ncbi:hypothetical protein PAF17_09630 [Paracoccus sp. Z330]|uniref:Uncharacterized protein n=1 Tax=Paracoccus onchidii TaxID=3017813 RepID=A0ABT4ZEG2_9RHOB|nr:hypothetical protein [Paracoccus onchidii]MDB6177760.1 hypothetical protein [Paracoccus onchidii]